MLLKVLVFLLIGGSAAAGDLPDRRLTPGERNPVLTQKLVCSSAFRTRPYRHVTQAMHRAVFRAYGLSKCFNTPSCRKGYEDDHLISLELGGSNSNSNRWPQSYSGKWNARVKDKLETHLHYLVCRGAMTQPQAQREISTNWIKAYQRRQQQIKRAQRLRLYDEKPPEN